MIPDSHFILDRPPDFDNMFVATGFSGRGCKFAPVVGEALADPALDGRAECPIRFLSAARFA